MITFLKTLSLLCKKITVYKHCLKFSPIHSDKIYFEKTLKALLNSLG